MDADTLKVIVDAELIRINDDIKDLKQRFEKINDEVIGQKTMIKVYCSVAAAIPILLQAAVIVYTILKGGTPTP